MPSFLKRKISVHYIYVYVFWSIVTNNLPYWMHGLVKPINRLPTPFEYKLRNRVHANKIKRVKKQENRRLERHICIKTMLFICSCTKQAFMSFVFQHLLNLQRICCRDFLRLEIYLLLFKIDYVIFLKVCPLFMVTIKVQLRYIFLINMYLL